MNNNILFSVVILTFNEEKNITDLLLKLERFSEKQQIEIICIDSSSTDKTPVIIKKLQLKYRNISQFQLNKSEFHYAKTRNYSIKLAKGKYIIFISGDALPLTKKMFNYLLEDFKSDNKIVAVFGKHIPRKNTPIIQKIEATINFDFLDKHINKKGLLIFTLKNPFIPYVRENYYLWWTLSNTFSCYRTDYLKKNPFPEINGFEDRALGKIILESGHIKIYDSRCLVLHSHNLNLSGYYSKQLEELVALNNNLHIPKSVNISYKIAKIRKLNITFLTKTYYLTLLFLYYLLKLIALIHVKFFVKYSL